MPVEEAGRRYHHAARELAYLARSPRELPSVLSQWSGSDVRNVPEFKDMQPYVVQCWQQARQALRR
jgi:hypothetical protein